VLGSVLAKTALGIAIGLPAAFVLSRFMAALLFGVSPGDALSYGSVAAVLAAVALLATLGPAVHAARVSPLTALRSE
jgi:ABC-type antimicrobial peptide transport system permease subunit